MSQIKFNFFLTLILAISFGNLNAMTLKPGDIVLISFNCYECRVIESETNSHFSHSGIVIPDETGELKIGQSLGMVALYNVSDFLKNKTPGTKAYVYRSHELEKKSESEISKAMLVVFNQNFKGSLFDSKYLWDNYDSSGRELLYCSEFVAKFIDSFLTYKTIPFPLSYQKNYAYWFNYFHGKIPEGELGNSPVSFSVDDRFHFIGTID